MYGILKSAVNTGSSSELSAVFAAPLQIINVDPANTKDSLNLRRVTSRQNVQRFEIMAALSPTVGDPSMLVMTAVKGHHSKYYLRMPQVATLAVSEGNIQTVGLKNTNSDSIDISGASKMVPGEFINIGNDPKVYLVVGAGENGVGVKIFPSLRKPAPDGSVIKIGKKVTMEAYLNTDVQLGITYVDGILSDPGQFSFVEAL